MQGAADCCTVNVCPAMVTVPVRELVEGFSATEMLTVPLPEPLAPPETVIHAAFEVAVQEQFEALTTFTPVVPPEFPRDEETLLSV